MAAFNSIREVIAYDLLTYLVCKNTPYTSQTETFVAENICHVRQLPNVVAFSALDCISGLTFI
jgi:hypothetical protein